MPGPGNRGTHHHSHRCATVRASATSRSPQPGRPPARARRAGARRVWPSPPPLWSSPSRGPGPEPRTLAADVHALVIAAPIGAGLYALYSQPASAGRFGWVLVLSGFLWSPTLLAESADSLLYSVGRVSCLVRGGAARLRRARLPVGPPDRAARTGCCSAPRLVTVGVLFLPDLAARRALSGTRPRGAAAASDCPPNAFMAVGSEPGFVDSFLIPLAQAASTSVIFAAVRWSWPCASRRAARLTRVGLLPVLAVAIAAHGRRSGVHASPAALSGLAADRGPRHGRAALHAGLLRRLRARACCARGWPRDAPWSGSVRATAAGREAATCAISIAEAVGDPSLEIVYWNPEDPGRVDQRRG